MQAIKPICCFLLLITLCPFPGQGQHYCREILDQAITARAAGDLSLALKRLQDAETCDFQNMLLTERQDLQTAIFKAVQNQKERAEKAAEIAENATKKAEVATKIAMTEKINALQALNKAQVYKLI